MQTTSILKYPEMTLESIKALMEALEEQRPDYKVCIPEDVAKKLIAQGYIFPDNWFVSTLIPKGTCFKIRNPKTGINLLPTPRFDFLAKRTTGEY